MVAVAQFIPQDPREKESVLTVLREHPELREFIQSAVQKAIEIFPEPRVALDSTRYEDIDPPVRLLLYVSESLTAFDRHYHRYARWLAHEAGYPQELISVMPLWSGSPKSISG